MKAENIYYLIFNLEYLIFILSIQYLFYQYQLLSAGATINFAAATTSMHQQPADGSGDINFFYLLYFNLYII